MRRVIHRTLHDPDVAKFFHGALLFLAALTLLFSFAAPVQSANVTKPRPIDPLARDFAYCAGRASAEFDENFGDPELRALKTTLQELMAATLPSGEEARYENMRIAAKVAHMDLLHTARFAFDRDVAARAAQLAHQEFLACQRLMLGG